MKTFEEWCQDREIVLNELSPKLLTMAYKIWGEDCFVEGQRYEAENAEFRHRAEVAERALNKACTDNAAVRKQAVKEFSNKVLSVSKITFSAFTEARIELSLAEYKQLVKEACGE